MTPEMVGLLKSISRKRGIPVSRVIESCILKYADTHPDFKDIARDVIIQEIIRGIR